MSEETTTPTSEPETARRPATRRTILGVVGIGAALVVLPQGRRLFDDGPRPNPTAVPSVPGDVPTAPGEDFSPRFAAFEPADEPDGDLARVEWPDFVLNANADVRSFYEFQVTNGELMRFMPCFCGCHLEDGHRNNRDCYVEAVNPDGSVVFDAMAPT